MQLKFRLFQRTGGVFYWQENGTTKQGSLRTKDRAEGERLLLAMNEAHKQPILNLALGRAYLSAHDPKLCTRTWQTVMEEMGHHGLPTTQLRCARALRSRAFDRIREKLLVETTAEDFLTICNRNGNSIAHYLRRLRNLALNLGWLAWPILHKAAWPKIRSVSKRAITAEEHAAIIASEKNTERRAYYELLYETGAAQTDAACLTDKNIDWRAGVLTYPLMWKLMSTHWREAQDAQDQDGKFAVAFKAIFDRGASPTKLKVTCRIAKTISDEIECEI